MPDTRLVTVTIGGNDPGYVDGLMAASCRPSFPRAQIAVLRRAAEIAPPQVIRLRPTRSVTPDLPPEGMALIEGR